MIEFKIEAERNFWEKTYLALVGLVRPTLIDDMCDQAVLSLRSRSEKLDEQVNLQADFESTKREAMKEALSTMKNLHPLFSKENK